MADSRTFSRVTVELVDHIKRAAKADGIQLEPREGPRGTATARTPVGDCIIQFIYDDAQSKLVLTLVKKPALIPSALLWIGLQANLDRLRRELSE